MDRIRRGNPRRLAIIAFILIVIIALMSFWMRGFVRELIVLPLSYLLYVAGIFIDATPQFFFWMAALIIGFWIAYRGLRMPSKQIRNIPPVQDGTAPTGRTLYWTIRVRSLLLYRSSYYQGGFHQTLGRLLIEMLAHRFRLTISQVEDRVRREQLELPDHVSEYARYVLMRQDPGRNSFFGSVWNSILEFLSSRLGINTDRYMANSPSDRAKALVDSIIQYMEDELEVPHEHGSQ
jgi:hypothetical protein